jgi:DNA-binding response OmpR family regulator
MRLRGGFLGFASGPTVLIVAAGRQLVRDLSELLLRAGYKVDIASEVVGQTNVLTAAQLVILFSFKSFWTIGETYKICSTIRRNAPRLPIVVVGSDDVNTKVKLFELGADDYLPESFDHQEFLARVKALVNRNLGI